MSEPAVNRARLTLRSNIWLSFPRVFHHRYRLIRVHAIKNEKKIEDLEEKLLKREVIGESDVPWYQGRSPLGNPP
jgi:hypothetical protein